MRLVVIGLACAGLLTACGQSKQQKTVYVGNGGTVSMSGNGTATQITVHDSKTNEQVEYNAGGAVSANLPPYVSVYPGAKVTASVVGSGSQNGGMIALETSASPDTVLAYYKQKTSAAGFSQTTSMVINGTTIYAADADSNKKSFQITVASQQGKTQAQIVWGQK